MTWLDTLACTIIGIGAVSAICVLFCLAEKLWLHMERRRTARLPLVTYSRSTANEVFHA